MIPFLWDEGNYDLAGARFSVTAFDKDVSAHVAGQGHLHMLKNLASSMIGHLDPVENTKSEIFDKLLEKYPLAKLMKTMFSPKLSTADMFLYGRVYLNMFG